MKKNSYIFLDNRIRIVAFLWSWLLILFAVPQLTAQTTHTVCASGCDFTTITAAIAAAAADDIIDVQDAEHTEEGITVDKGLTIQGQGQNTTTVQAHAQAGMATDRVFSVTTASAVIFKNMTIRHGNVAGNGGGVSVNLGGYDVTFENVNVTNNNASNGGGILAGGNNGSLTFTSCNISNNEGGGLNSIGATSVNMTDCVFSNNLAGNNLASAAFIGRGGLVATILRCSFYDNLSDNNNDKAALGLSSGNFTVTNSIFFNNTGGGIGDETAPGNNTFTIVNCTIANNTRKTDSGAGIRINQDLTLVNTIVVNNTTGGMDNDIYFFGNGTNFTNTNNIVESFSSTNGTFNPTFLSDSDEGVSTGLTDCGDKKYVNIAPSSPADDAGVGSNTNANVPATDICDNARANSATTTDIGAFEQTNPAITVCASGCDFSNIAVAISNAPEGGLIELQDPELIALNVEIDKSLTIKGQGQNTTMVQAHAQPNMATNKVFFVSTPSPVVFRDLTIRHGSERGGVLVNTNEVEQFDVSFINVNITENDNGNSNDGGGVEINLNDSGGNFTFQNCNITNNTALASGGGIVIKGNGNITATFENCNISDNTANNVGGGLSFSGTTLNMTDCKISGNTGGLSGGGITILSSPGGASLLRCTVNDNTANSIGGLSINGDTQLTNCTIFGNSGSNGYRGGIDISSGTTADFINSTIVNNTSNINPSNFPGAGIGVEGTINLINSLVVNNTHNGAAIDIHFINNELSLGTAIGSIVEATSSASGNFNPVFLSDSDEGISTTLTACNSGLNSFVMIAPNSAANDAGIGTNVNMNVPATDICGNARPNSTTVADIGSYEQLNELQTVCASGCTHTSMSAAVSTAVAGDAIKIMDAELTEQGIVLDKSLTILGEGTDMTAIQAHAAPGMATDRVFDIQTADPISFENLTIRHGNASDNTPGGAVKCLIDNFDISFTNVNFDNNTTNGDGGAIGVNATGGTLNLSSCEFSGNSTSGAGNGGAISNKGAAVFSLSNCAIDANTSANDGGAVYIDLAGSANTFSSCTFSGNQAGNTSNGGAISKLNGDATLINATFFDNTMAQNGGAYYSTSSGTSKMVNNTLVNNIATSAGGGIHCNQNLTLINTIVANNTANNTDNDVHFAGDGVGFANTTNLVETFSSAGGSFNPTFTATSDVGIATALMDCGGDSNQKVITISEGSAANDSGSGSNTDADVPVTDACGNVRPNAATVTDMGAYEQLIKKITVCASGCTVSDLSSAMGLVVTGDVIEIMDPVVTEQGIAIDKGVTIRGMGQTATIVQAHAQPNTATDRVFEVMTSEPVVFEDMTIRHGNSTEIGGGVNVTFTNHDVTFNNVTITENTADGGGGIGNQNLAGSLTLNNCDITNNTAVVGGAMFYDDGGASGMFSLTTCLISGNTATSTGNGGAGIFVRAITSLNDCTISGNQAPNGIGGGIYVSSGNITIINNTIFGNSATEGGGIFKTDLQSLLRVVNSTITQNTATTSGGGIQNRRNFNLINSIVVNNTANGMDNDIHFVDDQGFITTKSIVETVSSGNNFNPPFFSTSDVGIATTLTDCANNNQKVAQIELYSAANDTGIGSNSSADVPSTDACGSTRANSETSTDIGAYDQPALPQMTWMGGSSSNWNDAGNWDEGVVPTESVEVIFDGPISVQVPSGFDAVAKTVRLTNGATLNVNGGGTLTTNGENADGDAILVEDGANFINNGTVNSSGHSDDGIVLQSGGGANPTATNNGAMTLENSGGTESKAIELKEGTFNNESGATITVEHTGTGDAVKGETGTNFENDGIITVDFPNGVTPETKIAEGTGAFRNKANGRVRGKGRIDGGFFSFLGGGRLAPGFSPGLIAFDGDADFTNATFEIELADINGGSPVPGTHFDQITVSGQATFDGTNTVINVSLLGDVNYVPAMGDAFTIVTYASKTGDEPTINLPNGCDWNVDYGATGITITVNTAGCNPPIKWDGGGFDGNWSTPANWSTDAVPGASDIVTIDGTHNVRIDGQTAAAVTSLTLKNGVEFFIEDSGQNQIGSLTVSDVLIVEDNGTELINRGGVLTINGSGEYGMIIRNGGNVENQSTMNVGFPTVASVLLEGNNSQLTNIDGGIISFSSQADGIHIDSPSGTFLNDANSRMNFQINGTSIVVDSDGTTMTNNGTFFITSTNDFMVINGASTFNNNGLVEAQYEESVFGDYIKGGSANAFSNNVGGTVRGGDRISRTTFLNNGGTLAPTFNFVEDPMNFNIVPGIDPSIMTFFGGALDLTNSNIVINLKSSGGIAGTDNDQILGNDAITVDGTTVIDVSLVDGYTPAVDDEFIIIRTTSGTANAISGTPTINFPAGCMWETTTTDNEIRIKVISEGCTANTQVGTGDANVVLGSNTTSVSIMNFDVPAGDNRVIVVSGFAFDPVPHSVTFDDGSNLVPVPMTEYQQGCGDNNCSSIFYLTLGSGDAISGTITLNATNAGPIITLGAIAAIGVDQTTPVTEWVAGGGSSVNPFTATVTSSLNDLVVNFFGFSSGDATAPVISVGPGETTVFSGNFDAWTQVDFGGGPMDISSSFSISTKDGATPSVTVEGHWVEDAVLGGSINAVNLLWDGMTNGTALSVKLSDFTAQLKNTETHLDWTTASEDNNKGFVIERSTDGRDYDNIGWVTGTGNAAQAQQYQFIDPQPELGINYYRLKMVNNDGSFEYSPVRTVLVEKVKGTLSVFPNPISNAELNVNVPTYGEETAMLYFYNAVGQVVMQRTIGLLGAESHQESVSIVELPAGVYLLRVDVGESSLWEKVVVE